MAVRDNAGAGPAEAVIIALLPDPETAAQAIRQLKEAGFTDEEVGAIMRKRGPTGELLTEVVAGDELDVEAQEYFDQAVRGGGVLVTVQPGSPARTAEARSILRGAGADLGPSAESTGTPVRATAVSTDEK